MKNKTDMNLDYYIKNTTLQWRNSEWGFPKGRRNYRESDYKCAIREFKEETNLENKDFCMLTKIRPLEETITGTNGKKYKYVYYVGMINNSENELEIDKTNPDQVSEIGDIKWQTYLEAIDSIRVNRNNRKEILSKLFFFIVNKINHLLK
jgi:8-oxo-dGTP pyrophosphatase MutT (NUDIX family)